MACDPNTLLEDAKCIMYCVDRGSNMPIILTLLCAIMDNGGMTGSTFYILAETGAILNAENADRLRKE